MSGLFGAIVAVVRDDGGTSLAEYALLAATLGVAMIAGAVAIQNASGSVLAGNASGWQTAALSPP